ncbi:ATPase involved in DNA repair [hydrothermal vent metagenome]|uniref:ATPase involved in DNA repair n=1 Tax=hydrothermal vent metagenome TaxID=652676 RepID=A0A1W1E322_9ZZZZ
MTVNKVEYITKELPQLTLDITKIESEIQRLSHTESKLSKKVYKNDVIEDLNKIAVTLNKNYEDKGKWMERKERLKTSRQEIAQIEGKLSSIDEEIESKDDAIQQKISIFNEYFSKISNKLYEESFILSSNKSNGCYGLDISSLDGNVGTGMKKGQIAAFDLAYIQFADKLKLKCLHFILHDQIETVHGNQILKILTNIVPEINCQYIAPILKDKLPSGLDVSKYTVLNLSQDEKLFKIY